MKLVWALALSIVSSIGGFLEVGSITTAVQAGAEFRCGLLWAVAIGTSLVVHEYRVGAYALLERLASGSVRRAILAALPFTSPTLYRVPWHALDITDPKRPRLRSSVDDLERERRRPAA